MSKPGIIICHLWRRRNFSVSDLTTAPKSETLCTMVTAQTITFGCHARLTASTVTMWHLGARNGSQPGAPVFFNAETYKP